MKVDTTQYNLESFIKKQDIFCDNSCFLIFPSMLQVNWDAQNVIFRSSIWDLYGNLVSAGFKKFVNFGEKPEIFGQPKSLKNSSVFEKVDGSCMIVDYYNNMINARTRGTFNYRILDNAGDYKYALEQNPQIEEYLKLNQNLTLLFEIVTPNNKIVIDYGSNVDIYLLGVVDKTNYTYWAQKNVTELALKLNLKRPKQYFFKTLEECIETVQALKNQEGVVIYTNNDQDLFKVKSTDYLMKHAFKEHASLESVIDLFLAYNKPNYLTFCQKIDEAFDYECRKMVDGYISQTLDAYKEVCKIQQHMKSFADSVKTLNRKDAAEKILSSYGNTNRSGFVFMLLDNKQWTDKEYKKLLWQVLKQ